ncbi:haloacid dehalogenase type II [Halomarina ordinaria]|uniref:Haloacid dehalogenase type II n=1 Tax=Halomarina ordinaria TaxID=3033939 RepID=A0ABD5UCN6_9EURY|nr:haloacid dehalogenase type II [Halomarina sp. PSRA2]
MEPTFEPERVETVTFDSYGTLVDTGAASEVLDGVVDDPVAVARRWRENALFFSVVAGALEEYETYMEMHCDGLRDALRAEGVALDDERVVELNDVYHRLDPYEDVARGFDRLADAGYSPSILSNGNPEMLDSLVETTGIETSVEVVVSADEVRTFKPEASLYEHAAERVGTPVDRVAHVTAHWMDVQGADNAGMQGVWLDRDGGEWTAFGEDPSLVVASLDECCERLGC